MLKRIVYGMMLTLLLMGILLVSVLPLVSSVQQIDNPCYFATYSGESTLVSGLISENTTWTLAGSPYIVVGNIMVEPGVFLKTEPGIVVKFTSGTNLLIDGDLIAQGNSTHKITFTSNATTPAPGDWEGILIRSSGHCNMANSVIEYANIGIHFESYEGERERIFDYSQVTSNIIGIKVSGGWWNVFSNGLIVEENVDCGIYVNGFIVIKNSFISHNNIGINVYGGPYGGMSAYLGLTNSTISYNVLDGVHGTPYHMISIQDSDIVSNGGKGIQSHGYWLTCSNSRISNNSNGGIDSDYYQGLSVTQCGIDNNNGHGIVNTNGPVSILESVISNNSGNGVLANRGEMHFTSVSNYGLYEIENTGSNDINATHNWWGTTNEVVIEERIYDYYDDYSLGRVLHEPYLMAPLESYPVASFLYEPSEPVVNETVTFDASASYDSDGSIASYSWDFGDDTNANETKPITNHAYRAAGTYTITLNVTDNDGLTDISKESISVGKLNSTISISASSTTLIVGENTTINGIITPTREGATVTIWYRHLGEYTWGNLTAIVTDENSAYSYAWTPSELGTYELKASWIGDENTFGTESSAITVTRLSPPVPGFTYSPAIPAVGGEITFNASSSYDVDEDIASYLWDFDDGNITSAVSPIIVHAYIFPRTYNVTLTVIDAAGLNSSVSQTVPVKMPVSVSVLTSSSSTFVGFKVNITGTLSDIHGNGLSNETVVLSYTFSGIGTWTPITSDTTDSFGNYFAMWIPPATGYFVLKAEWVGNSTHFGANNTATLSSLVYNNLYIFSVESNSTISELAFDTKNWKLSFSATGPNGTRGYVKVIVAKSLVTDIANIRVYLDGRQFDFSITSLDDSWLLTINYMHSAHQVVMDLDINIIPEFPQPIILLLFAFTTLIITILLKKKARNAEKL